MKCRFIVFMIISLHLTTLQASKSADNSTPAPTSAPVSRVVQTSASLEKFLKNREYHGVRLEGNKVGGLKSLVAVAESGPILQMLAALKSVDFTVNSSEILVECKYHGSVKAMQIKRFADSRPINMGHFSQTIVHEAHANVSPDASDSDLEKILSESEQSFTKEAFADPRAIAFQLLIVQAVREASQQ